MSSITTDQVNPPHTDEHVSQLFRRGESGSENLVPVPTNAGHSDRYNHWDVALATFFRDSGLTQTLRGFESDMLILNEEWEKGKVRGAVQKLLVDLALTLDENVATSENARDILDKRKLEYAHFAPGVEPRTPSTTTKSISRFLAQNRARNDASNRQEFLLSLSEKRRKLNENGDRVDDMPPPSCARTDAKTQNRDVQMKFDVAKNEDGPLRKTVNARARASEGSPLRPERQKDTFGTPIHIGEPLADAGRYPALDERLELLEDHLAVRYVPSPPRLLLDRLKFLEDHIIQLENEYPPWAALHFKQPRRGWPPPPRPTPIIVPSHLTSSSEMGPITSMPDHSFVPPDATTPDAGGSAAARGKGKQAIRNTKSSLHRAVMERLEVQKAMDDLAGKE